MSDREPDHSVRYCQECGEELRPNTDFCTQCGAEQPVANQPVAQPQVDRSPQQPHPNDPPPQQSHPNDPPPQQPHPNAPPPQQPPNGGRSTLETVLIVLGVIVGAVILIPIVAAIIAAFVLGLGGDQIDEAVTQIEGEQTVEAYYQAYADGDDAEARSHLHSAGPAADDLTTTPGNSSISNSNGVVTVLESTVVREEDDQLILSVKLEFEEPGQETQTLTVRVDLRTEDEELRIWQFL